MAKPAANPEAMASPNSQDAPRRRPRGPLPMPWPSRPAPISPSIDTPPFHQSNSRAVVAVGVIAVSTLLSLPLLLLLLLESGGLGVEVGFEPPVGSERRYRQISLKNLCRWAHTRKRRCLVVEGLLSETRQKKAELF